MRRFFSVLALMLPATAAAGPHLEARVDGGLSQGEHLTGQSLGARVGAPLSLGIVRLVPEVGLTHWNRSGLFAPDVGAQLRFGQGIAPGVYAHRLFPLGGADGPNHGWDAGASLAFTFIPKLDITATAGVASVGRAGSAMDTAFVTGLRVGFNF